MSHSVYRFSTSGAATEPKYEAEMRQFAEKTLKMDYYIVEQGIQRAEKTYQTGHRAPQGAPFLRPVYDFSEEALRQSKMRGFYYLTYASYFCAYYFVMLQPHSMYAIAGGLASIFMTSGLLNH